MTLECDVLVVGAGPAGSSASFFLKHFDKEDDLNVILVDRLVNEKYPVYHDMCGEGVSSELFNDIEPIKPQYIVERVRRLLEYWPGKIEIETPMNGYIIDRPKFLLGLLERFEKMGGKFKISQLIDFDETSEGIKTKFSDGTYVKSKYLVGADGSNSIIRKKLGFRGKTKTLLQYIVDEEPKHDTLIFEYDEKWEGDYKWIFPHGENTKIGFPYVKHKEKIDGEILAKQSRTVGFGGLMDYVYNNILLIGDAGCQNNPITKGGIRPAMVAGKMAAQAVINSDPQEYNEKWKKSDFASPLFNKAFDHLRKMSNIELSKHMEPFKNGVNMLSNIKSLFYYPKYRDLYRAYELSNKVGW